MNIMQKIALKAEDLLDQQGITLAFLGDSVTQGCFEVYRKDAGSIETIFDQDHGYHHDLEKLLAYLYPSVPFSVINGGISGDSAPHGLERLERDVLIHRPDFVVVCFGLNDSTQGPEKVQIYVQALEGIFTRLRESGTEFLFMTPNMMCTRVDYGISDPLVLEAAEQVAQTQTGGVLDLYLDAARELCRRMDVRVCDCYAKWKTLDRQGVDIVHLLANKINHPTREMNWLFAVSLLETMMAD